MVGEILTEMEWRIAVRSSDTSDGEKKLEKAPPKLMLFAGHDTTLMPLLCALRVAHSFSHSSVMPNADI